MADRVSFTVDFLRSDKFSQLPLSTQALYIQLCAAVEHKGLINNPVAIAKSIGATGTDIKILENAKLLESSSDGFWKLTDWYNSNSLSDAKSRLTYGYQKWRTTVLERDNYTCAICGSKRNLEVHHIKPFKDYESERLNTDNGVTLCRDCHRRVHKEKNSEWIYSGK